MNKCDAALDRIRGLFTLGTPNPEPSFERVGKCEYYFLFILASIGFIIAYIYLIVIIHTHFYGVNNDDNEEYDSKDRRVHNPARRLFKGNLHVVLSAILPIFTANGILTYRAVCCGSHRCAKIFHAVWGIIPIPGIIATFNCVANWWKYTAKPHTNYRQFTYHDWIGYGYLAFFCLQFLVGLIVYGFLPLRTTSDSVVFRARFSTFHTSFGLVAFILSVVVCLTGIIAYAGTMYSDVAAYRVKTAHTKLHVARQTHLQITAVLYALATIPVIYVIAKEQFRLHGPPVVK